MAAVVVELIVAGWRVTDPVLRYRLRLPSLVMPPVTAMAAPIAAHGGYGALLQLPPWSAVSLGPVGAVQLAAGLFAAIAAIFVLQEMLPGLAARRRALVPCPASPAPGSRLWLALAELCAPRPSPPCYELPVRTRALSVRRLGGQDALVFGLDFPDWLDDEELRAVLAHELAHIERRDLLARRILFVFRALQLHAPLALVEHRLLLADSEEACDAASVARQRAPMALAAGLLKSHGGPVRARAGEGQLALAARRLRHAAHASQVRRRVRTLLDPPPPGEQPGTIARVATMAALAALLLAVV